MSKPSIRKHEFDMGRLYALLIVTNGQLEVARNDTLLLVVTRRVTCKLENLGSKVFKDGGKVD